MCEFVCQCVAVGVTKSRSRSQSTSSPSSVQSAQGLGREIVPLCGHSCPFTVEFIVDRTNKNWRKLPREFIN